MIYFFSSLCLHVILLLMIAIYLSIAHDTTLANKNSKIMAYIEHLPINTLAKNIVAKNIVAKKKTINPQTITSAKKSFPIKHPIMHKMKKNSLSSQAVIFLSNKNLLTNQEEEKRKETLLAVLHQEIAAKQSYPTSALMLNETGTTRIRFLLYPDGHMEQISLLKSSGFANLDSSALSALKEIVPIKEAAIYLQKKTFFSVDVVFE